MENQLRQLQSLTENLVLAFNRDTVEFNDMVKELDEKDQYIAKLEYSLKRANELVVKQKQELEALLAKHNQDVTLANSVIVRLEEEVGSLRADNKAYKAMNPKKLTETNKKQKVSLAEKQSTIKRLEGSERNLRRDNDRLRVMLEMQRIGEFRAGRERVIPFLPDEVIRKSSSLAVDRNFHYAKWWMHESGLQLLIAYDKEIDDLVISNPVNEDGELWQPSTVVSDRILKELRAASKKNK